VKAASAGGTKPAPDGAAKARELPLLGKHVADFAIEISVDDYLVGKLLARGFSFFLTVDVLQVRAKGNLLLFRLQWRPRRLSWCLGRGVALSVPVVRFWRSLPSRTRWALCPAG
jgi:hypothetical protein